MPNQQIDISEKQLKTIIDRLDAIARLIALSLPKEISPDDKITALASIGFSPASIGPVVGMTPNAVSIRLFKMRQKAKSSSESAETDSKAESEKTESSETV